jgi:serine phosphatase RsbU (regulator of sigma subunit)
MSLSPSKYIAFLFFTLFSSLLFSRNILQIEENNEDRWVADSLYESFEDKTNSLTINDVAKKDFKFQQGNKLIGDPRSTYWIKLAIKGDTSLTKKWVLEIYNVHIDHISLFKPQKKGSFIESKTGYNLPFDQREYKTINFVFDIDVNSNNINYYYFKIKSDNPAWLETHLRTNNYYTYYAVSEYYLLGLFYGIILIMAVYNLLIFFSTKEVVYIYYLLYVLLSGLVSILEDGTGFAHLWSDYPAFSDFASTYARLLWLLAFIIYSKKFLKIKDYYPKYNKWLNIIAALYVIVFSIEKISGHSILVYESYLTPYIFLYVLSIMVWLKKKYSPASFFVYGFTVVLLSIFISIMRDNGYGIETGNKTLAVLIVYAINIGVIIEILFLSFSLGNRIKFLKDSTEIAQEKTITQLKENEILKDKVNTELEDKVQERTQELNKKNKDILDSISYAQRIQTAVLPNTELINRVIPNGFVFHRSKDIVSGDFLWVEEQFGKKYFSVIDCTGHGVPGAFMSIMANNNLNYLLKEQQLESPGKILQELDKRVKETVKQSKDEFNDLFGMDMSLCALDDKKGELEYSGAFNPLWVYNGDSLNEYKAERYPVGHYFFEPDTKTFQVHSIKINKGDRIYLFSDGYQDQFGGENGAKFLKAKLKELILSTAQLSLREQKEKLETTFDEWKGNHEQIDDVMILCVEV